MISTFIPLVQCFDVKHSNMTHSKYDTKNYGIADLGIMAAKGCFSFLKIAQFLN